MGNVQYVVKEGDTLWDLSARFLGDPLEWPRLYAYNNRPAVIRVTGRKIKDPDLIYIGQKLLIPILLENRKTTKNNPKSAFHPYRAPTRPMSLKEQISKTYIPFATKYRLEDIPVIISEYPGFTATIKLSGNVVIKLANMVPLSYVTNKGLEASFKAQTDYVLGQLLSDTYVGLNSSKITYRSMMVANSTTPGASSTAIGLAIASDKPVPVLRGEIRYPKLTGQINRHDYAAIDVKVVIEIEPKVQKTKQPESEYEPYSQPVALPATSSAVQEGIEWGVLTGAALLIGTIASDFLSRGVGLADDWVTIPLALSMMGVTVVAQQLPAQAPIQIH